MPLLPGDVVHVFANRAARRGRAASVFGALGRQVPTADRFAQWMEAQDQAGRAFTDEQRAWLVLIRDHVAASLAITPEDFEEVPFVQHGGLGKAVELFGDDLSPLLDELTEALVA